MADFTGKTVIVTGGLRGVGSVIVSRLAKEEGVNIAVLAKASSEDASELFLKYKQSFRSDVRFFQVDMANADSIKAAIHEVHNTFNSIDMVINAATVCVIKSVNNTSEDILDLSYNINARSAYLVNKYAFEYLCNSQNPQVLNICPPINLDPQLLANKMAYCASQYMKSMLTVSLAENVEWRKHGIQVNALWPLYPFEDSDSLHIYQSHSEKSSVTKPVKCFGDAAFFILSRPENGWNGEFFYDVEIIDMHQSGEADNILQQQDPIQLSKADYAFADDD